MGAYSSSPGGVLCTGMHTCRVDCRRQSPPVPDEELRSITFVDCDGRRAAGSLMSNASELGVYPKSFSGTEALDEERVVCKTVLTP